METITDPVDGTKRCMYKVRHKKTGLVEGGKLFEEGQLELKL